MQPVNWYIQRLKSMSAGEIIWRVKSLMRDQFDRIRIPLKLYPGVSAVKRNCDNTQYGFTVSQLKPGFAKDLDAYQQEWVEKLIKQADLVCQHKLSFFDLDKKYFGDPIDWHTDQNLNVTPPKSLSLNIDYRDIKTSGDCKLVWEPNRHQHLLVLARAYVVTGNEKYVKEILTQISSWWQANPFGYGMNWRSALELGVRAINWIWIYDLIKDSNEITDQWKEQFIHSCYLHSWDSARKYSQGSSANNHLIGEVAGVFITVSYFNCFPHAESMIEEAKQILEKEILLQSFEDGCTREHGLGYQYFVLQFYLLCGLVGRWTNNDFSAAYWARIEKMLEFTGLLTEQGDEPPMFGDCDDGYVVDMGQSRRSFKDLLSVGAILFNRPDFKYWSQGLSESSIWLLGIDAIDKYNAVEELSSAPELESREFKPSGYYLLQSGHAYSDDAISVFFDCAELGYTSIAAHGNADALSFVLKAFGKQILVDPGTYDYFTYPDWREYFKSTRAHNTVEIDKQDQSIMLGPFLWGHRATATCITWEPSAKGGRIIAEHDGYQRLPDPVTHRRELTLNGDKGEVLIIDHILANAEHDIVICFQLSEECQLMQQKDNHLTFTIDNHNIEMLLDESLEIEILNGSTNPKGGWVSRGYHKKTPSNTVLARAKTNRNSSFKSIIKINPPSP